MHADDVVIIDTMDEVTSFKYYVASPDKMPREIIGVTGRPKVDNVPGVKFDNGTRTAKDAANYADDALSATGAWVVLCLSDGTAADYQAVFAARDSKLIETLHFQRIDVLHFERKAP